MSLWYLSHRRPAKAHQTHWMAAHARLKNEFTEDKKCHNLMPWLKFELFPVKHLRRYIGGTRK